MQQQDLDMDVDTDGLLAEEGAADADAESPVRAAVEAYLRAEAQQQAKGGRRKSSSVQAAVAAASLTGHLMF
jgi:hypothetical protein